MFCTVASQQEDPRFKSQDTYVWSLHVHCARIGFLQEVQWLNSPVIVSLTEVSTHIWSWSSGTAYLLPPAPKIYDGLNVDNEFPHEAQ